MGSPLSPLLGAIALKPLDDAMEKLDIFYVRYVDDWCILAKSKFKLRHAIKKMHRVLEKLQLKTHPDKTFIGRCEKSWLFSKIYGWMVAPQVYQAGDRALSASSPVF